ncbi:hypothetical protein GH714_029546 [Hevea brasiliensis]|uniref:PB1-like domain-containing protein n=1 Tax=Hevea brasiliensis TaxID=3981 RepID=A0A6A6M5K6_HEVBR|nr:hypothetical protein GH714_029546 [Hevea brasiliensis]
MTKRVNLAIHYGGKWQSIDTMMYDGDEVIYCDATDIDYLSMFEMLGYAKELEHKNGAQMWFKIYREFHANGRDGDLELGQTIKTGNGDIENEMGETTEVGDGDRENEKGETNKVGVGNMENEKGKTNEQGDVDRGFEKRSSEASWLYDDMEGSDNDIFMNVPCADASNSPPKETSRDYGETHRVHIDAIDLQEEDFAEFNEDAESNEDLYSLQGSEDE